MIKAECRRNLVNGRTAAAIVLIALILVFGNWDLLYSYLKHGGNVRVTDYGSVPLLRFSLAIDRVKLLIVLVLLLFAAGICGTSVSLGCPLTQGGIFGQSGRNVKFLDSGHFQFLLIQ